MKYLNKFVQSAVSARRDGDENTNSSVVAEQLGCLQTVPTAIKLWTEAAILIQNFYATRRCTQPLKTKCLKA